MKNSIKTVLTHGTQGLIIEVECSLSNGLPNIIIVGLGNKVIDEAKERIRSAFSNSKLQLPRKRIIINLAPADIPKSSTSFDLAIAIAILHANKSIGTIPIDSAFIGELGLDGSVRSVRGVIGMLLAGKANSVSHFYIPQDNLEQALLVPGISVTPISSLSDITSLLETPVAFESDKTTLSTTTRTQSDQLDEIAGQTNAKRALSIAAAGGHNIFLYGPPGTGKSMLAKALPSLLPPMTVLETLEVTQIHSLATRNYEKIITERPFRAPHHSASQVAIIGGGNVLKPGEISLSHLGVLLLDEMPEFTRATLEALRQPLEDRIITVSRARDSVMFPANFILAATANPCPCGYYGTLKDCRCTPSQIIRYQQKVSGPILDRIDLHVSVDQVEHTRLLDGDQEATAAAMRKKVEAAREMQHERYASNMLNSSLTNRELRDHAHLTKQARDLLDKAAVSLQISARNYIRIVKVARTIADLDGEKSIDAIHISEAFQFRKQSQNDIR